VPEAHHRRAHHLQFSEIGVVLLLFIIGLEPAALALWVMRHTVSASARCR